MKLRLEHYIYDFNNRGLSYETAEAIADIESTILSLSSQDLTKSNSLCLSLAASQSSTVLLSQKDDNQLFKLTD
ncbi:18017_t:CDS:2 [Dentiscutata erythropus]|uniref:18017_t:CDS:1 n=1 Tax=Dentiscutata erythropus TaxID=1348616 RepID=A0A9N9B196_9GLOM|nr:18017_t:CDS:2 [Dentiscutata erythropus]